MLAATTVSFRAAFSDESGRAAYLSPDKTWNFPESRWFVALTEGPPERIIGCIRYSNQTLAGGHATETDFRLVAGAGGELAGNEPAFLAAFLPFCGGDIHYADSIPEGDRMETLLQDAGFSIVHREQFFETPWDLPVLRVAKVADALRRQSASPLALATIIPARHCPLEMALPLLTNSGLMTAKELRSIWNSPDPTQMDRDASACLVLGGETLGVVICADGGSHLRVKAVIGREDIPGARRRAIPLLMDHAFRLLADRGYQHAVFRANVETAAQTVNLALRLGGRLTGETRRWGKSR